MFLFELLFITYFYRQGYLDKQVKASLPGIHNDEWPPLQAYRNSLTQHNEFDIPLNQQPSKQYNRNGKRGRDEDGKST
jgi:hypothetical protein